MARKLWKIADMLNFTKFYFTLLVTMLSINLVNPSQNSDENEDMVISKQKFSSVATEFNYPSQNKNLEEQCPTDIECSKLGFPCISCSYNRSCVYGVKMQTHCHSLVDCIGEKEFTKELICRYCYQTDHWEHSCVQKGNCNSVASPRFHYRANCTVKNEILCLGRRTFFKNLLCNWTGGYRWSTALALSVTLGGFGADRFYLGHWQEGIGKLFSFGGLGVWTLIDVVLIAIHYLGPADGSLYT
ncbi:TM2 domain-containing protein 3 almondex isoform X2 [Lycorma delicatula]|uniref:TM2 domain-containing protein 3 almondex isoform X2 n=1 Tax=Lycorma delicatula TaxID=130591 RepID=UPI003F511C2C